jgi:streptogramin lyase
MSRPSRPFSRWFFCAFLLSPSLFAQQKKFTTNQDFDGGQGSNVCHGPAPKIDCWDPTPDQLVLGRTRVSKLNRVWADNYRTGWIVGLDANTGKQFARFDAVIEKVNGQPTGVPPANQYCNFASTGNCPGRVTTDVNGDVWIINRAFGQQGSLSKFSGSIDHCIDRNGNGIIDTSSDVNGDGIVSVTDPAEYLGQGDECILTTIPLGPPGAMPRGVAVDKKGKIWASTWATKQIFRFNPNEPVALEQTINLAGTAANNCNPYSMATGGDYLFVSCSGGPTVRIHIDTLAIETAPCPGTYGVVADPTGSVAYLGGYFTGQGAYRADFSTIPPTCTGWFTGVTVTAMTLDNEGFVWASGYGGNLLFKMNPLTGAIISQSAAGSLPHGLSVDFNDRIWSIMHQNPYIRVFNTNNVDISATLATPPTLAAGATGDPDPYLYSDFTGTQIDRQAPYTRLGSWSGVHDAIFPATPWTSVSWNSESLLPLPPDTKIAAAVRAADSLELLGQAAFVPVLNGAIQGVIQGRFVEVKVDLSGPGYATPVLTDLTVAGPCGDNPGPGCCIADTDCVAPDACSLGTCPSPGSKCVFQKKDDCCLSDLDCDDGNPCTTGTCPVAGGPCDQVKAADCCIINKDCDDGQLCTVDICSGFGGTCSNKEISGCCYQDKDCDTGNKCLTAKCPAAGQLCELTPVPGCCNVDSDCNDNNACTLDACDVATSTCKVPEKVAGCCLSDADCDDGNECTQDLCSEPGGQCKHKDVAECCVPGGPGEGDACEPPKSPNDQPPCQAGKKKCNPETNKFECEGAVKPSTEVCDGVDNDCDGEVDKGESLCGAGKACVQGQCASACKQGEFPCPTGQVCEEGYCITPGGVGGSSGSSGQGGGSGTSGEGGSNAGGSNAGGSNAGGSNTGGSNAGGSNTGGSNTGGSNAGGSNAGGSNAGGSNAGGTSAGGASAGSATAPGTGAENASEEGGCGCQVPGAPSGRSWAGMSGLILGWLASRGRRHGHQKKS